MKKAPFNQLDIDDLRDIGKYIFSIANGNHICRYTEEEYRNHLAKNPSDLIKMLVIYHASLNWGYDDPRMFDDYDEQWIASKIDPQFDTELDFDLDDFHYDNLHPYQKAVIDFTQIILDMIKDWDRWFSEGSPLEKVYAVFASNLHLDKKSSSVLNKNYAIKRGKQMFKSIEDSSYTPNPKFESWELVIY